MHHPDDAKLELRKPKDKTPFNKLSKKSQATFEAVFAGDDVKKLYQLTHPDNQSWRAEFESRTGLKLPDTVGGSRKVVDDYLASRPAPSAPVAEAAAEVADQVPAGATDTASVPEVKGELPEHPWQATRDQYLQNLQKYESIGETPARSTDELEEIVNARDKEYNDRFGAYFLEMQKHKYKSGKNKGIVKPSFKRDFEFEKQAEEFRKGSEELNNEYNEALQYERRLKSFDFRHKGWVNSAIQDGKDVPESVLADYPDIKKKIEDDKAARAAQEAGVPAGPVVADARETAISRYEQQAKTSPVIKGKKGTVEIMVGDKRVPTNGEILGDTGFAIVKQLDDEGKPYTSLTHMGTGYSLTSDGTATEQKILAKMLHDVGVHGHSKTVQEVQEKFTDTAKAIINAWKNNDYRDLPEELFDALAKNVSMPQAREATFVLGKEHIAKKTHKNESFIKDATFLVKSLSDNVPEFAHNPVLTVTENGTLVYKDHFKYEFPMSAFVPEGVNLKAGDTVAVSLEDFGIKPREQEDVVRSALSNVGFQVRKNKDGYAATYKGETVKILGKGKDWTVQGNELGEAYELASRQVKGLAWSQPPAGEVAGAAPIKAIDDATALDKPVAPAQRTLQEIAEDLNRTPEEQARLTESLRKNEDVASGKSQADDLPAGPEEFQPTIKDGKIDFVDTTLRFASISPIHEAYANNVIAPLVKSKVLTDGDAAFLQTVLSKSDMRYVSEELKGAKLTRG